jgi:hypothetical protein
MVRLFKYAALSVWFCVFVLVALTSWAASKQQTEIEVHNGYFLSVQTEIKCDWDGTRYKFHDWTTVRSRSKTVIIVPYGLKKCELWPAIRWN